MLQSSVLPGTSTHRAMQEDGLIPDMTEMSHPSTCALPRRLTVRRGLAAAAGLAGLAGCTASSSRRAISCRPTRWNRSRSAPARTRC